MKKYIQNMGWLFLPDKIIPLDKQAHVAAGLYFGLVFFVCLTALFHMKWLSFALSNLLVFAIGYIKEKLDKNEELNKFDKKDLIATCMGGLIINVILIIVYQYEFS